MNLSTEKAAVILDCLSRAIALTEFIGDEAIEIVLARIENENFTNEPCERAVVKTFAELLRTKL